jgi:hypothetical protein
MVLTKLNPLSEITSFVDNADEIIASITRVHAHTKEKEKHFDKKHS